MIGSYKLNQALDDLNTIKQSRTQFIPAVLGTMVDGVQTVEVNGRRGYVYARVRDNQSELIQAYNDMVSPVYGLPVLLSIDPNYPNRYRVVDKDLGRYQQWYSAFVPRHGNQHSLSGNPGAGGDPVFVYGRQFMPLNVYPSGSLGSNNLIVDQMFLWKNDTWTFAGGTGTATFAAFNPVTGSQARMVLVYLDSNYNPALLGGSIYFANTITGSSQIVPYIPDVPAGTIPLAAVRLVTGTSVLDWSNIYDVRPFFGGTESGNISTGSFASLAEAQAGVLTDKVISPNTLPVWVINGAFIRRDGYAGNTRGNNAVDLQNIRYNDDEVASGDYSVIAGGYGNKAAGAYSFIGGGEANFIYGDYANSILGGDYNVIDDVDSYGSTIAGGESNYISGSYSAILGGSYHVVNANYATAIGQNAFITHQGAILISDLSTGDGYFYSQNAFEVAIRAKGGVRIAANLTVTGTANLAAIMFNGVTGSAGRITQWSANGKAIVDSTLIKSGTGTLTLAAAGNFVISVPATGSLLLGSGTATQIAVFGSANTITSNAGLTWGTASGIGLRVNYTPALLVSNYAADIINTITQISAGGYTAAGLRVYTESRTSTSYGGYGGYFQFVAYPNYDIGSSGFGYGIFATATLNTTGSIGAIGAANFTTTVPANASSISTLSGVNINITSGGAPTTNAYGLRITTAGTANASTYGIKVENVTAVTNAYALYTGTGLVRMGDAASINISDAVTNVTTTAFTLAHNSSGVPVSGFGTRTLWQLKGSANDQNAAALDVTWNAVASGTTLSLYTLHDGVLAERWNIQENVINEKTGRRGKHTLITGTYAALDETYYLVDVMVSGSLLVLPNAVNFTGQEYNIFSDVNSIFISGTSGQNINGASGKTLNQYESVRLHSNGSNWRY